MSAGGGGRGAAAGAAGLIGAGCDEAWAAARKALPAPGEPARVAAEHKGGYELLTGSGVARAIASGRLRRAARDDPAARTVVGDWVLFERPAAAGPGAVTAQLPRRSLLVRRAAGDRHLAQPVAANVDLALVVTALGHDFNPRRIERYLALCAEAGVPAHVVLSKSDLASEEERTARLAETVALLEAAGGSAEHALLVSVRTGLGLAALEARLSTGSTVVLVGSSGVGKSTLLNLWLGKEAQSTSEVRAHDHRGRHTTTHRALFRLPAGALVIDTPGMRELGLDGDAGLTEAFSDVEAMAAGCRFRDCAHGAEPGCAVHAAVEGGALAATRLAAYRKLIAEGASSRRPRRR